jgi:hypothetical protein
MMATPAAAQEGVSVNAERAAAEARAALLMQRHMSRCWRMPTGAADPGRLIVTVEFNLKEDGTLDGEPRIVEPLNADGDAELQDAIEAVLSAVALCAPYPFPNDPVLGAQYQTWREVELTFRPLTE